MVLVTSISYLVTPEKRQNRDWQRIPGSLNSHGVGMRLIVGRCFNRSTGLDKVLKSEQCPVHGYPSIGSLAPRKVDALRCGPSFENSCYMTRRKDLCATWYPPLKIRLSGQLAASINFPRTVPPDSDLARSIRL